MIPIVCFCSFIFGNWSMKWDAKNERFRFNYYFVFTSSLMLCTALFFVYELLKITIQHSINTNPQYMILYTIHINLVILLINRWWNVKDDERFVNELKSTCGRTVESGRYLPEFYFRMAMVVAMAHVVVYKFRTFENAPPDMMGLFRAVVPIICSVFVSTTVECQYTSACNAITEPFAVFNRRTETVTGATAPSEIRQLSTTHCRLLRLVRLFNRQYSAAMFITTFNMLISQIYMMNDIVSMVVDGDKLDESHAIFSIFFDLYMWLSLWWRFWWVCYRVDRLVTQVHLALKIMLKKDLNSYPEDTRRPALDFLDQLLHRHVRITAWGFYDINKELLFMVLGYQFGVCLICIQFTTSSVQWIQNQTNSKTNNNYTHNDTTAV